MSLVRLTRRVTFSSGHRYWLKRLSPEENRATFGTWASPFNHGHNYTLEVTCSGQINPENGMVVNIKTIDDILKREVLAKYDQKSINDEVEGFEDQAPSLENLLLTLASGLQPNLPPEANLESLKLRESDLLFGEFSMNTRQLTLSKTYEFAASHRLHSAALSQTENDQLFGKCNNPNGHGHNYVLEVTVSGNVDPVTGMMVDLGSLDKVVHAEVVDRYDHKNLNLDVPEFRDLNPTSEVVALMIFDRLRDSVPVTLERVRLWETARNVFEVNRGEF